MGIFTIGDEKDYDAALAQSRARDNNPPARKLGPYTQADGSIYYGGYAFETASDAFAYILKIGKRGSYAVYEMDAVWPEDVWHSNPIDEFMLLKRDAALIRKIEEPAAANGTHEDAFAGK